VNVYHDDNHEPIQPFDEVVFARQAWQFATPDYNLLRIGAFTPITTSVGFQHQPHHTTSIWYPLIWKWNDFTY
jgi:hypothetical protein